MGRYEKLLLQILRGHTDANVDFDELRHLLQRLGFVERVSGSHHIYRRDDVRERLNLQRAGKDAKPYQVRQVRAVIINYRLSLEEE